MSLTLDPQSNLLEVAGKSQLAWRREEDLPVALIFRMRLLAFSETFIRSQAEAMTTFRPFFVGIKKVKGLEIPAESTWMANEGGWLGMSRELRFRMLGPNSGCVDRLRGLNPKVIHAHFGPDACEAIPLVKSLGTPLIATFHGYDATLTDKGFGESKHGRRYLRQRGKLQGNVTMFLAVSDFIRKRLQMQDFPMERTKVHYIGVDLERFRPPEKNERSSQVLFVARLVEKKGCAYLLKAMAEVQKQLPEAELIIIGDGNQRESLEAEARQSLRNYKFLGAQPTTVIQEWMRKVKLFCVPSVTASNGDSEGFGLVFAEAQACGLPVVSFATGGVPEAVAHGTTGFLAPERNWRVLGQYIHELLTSQTLWNQFSHAARRRVERKFDLRKQTESLEEIYEQVANPESSPEKRLRRIS